MDKRKKVLKDMGAVSHTDHIEKKYGKKGSEKREKFENELQLEIIGETLKKIRKEQNVTQSQLAKLMGSDKTYISRIENNVKTQRIDTIVRFLMGLESKLTLKINTPRGEYQMEL